MLVRMTVVLLLLFLLWFTHETTGWRGAPGLLFFQALVWIDLLFISLAALSHFASSITEEKEEGTLGLLRLANLNALSILLGKGTGRLFGVLILLLVQIPFALVAVTMGGLSVPQIFASYVSLLAYTFLVANLGLLTSVLYRRTNLAASVAMALLGVFLFGPWFARRISDFLGYFHLPTLPGTVSDLLLSWHTMLPGPRVTAVLGTGFHGSLWSAQATLGMVLGTLCFLGAWAAFEPAAMRASDPDAALAPRRARLRRSQRAQDSGPPAVRWAQFKLLGGRKMFVIRTTLLVLSTVGMLSVPRMLGGASDWTVVRMIMLGNGVVFSILYFTSDAAAIFGAERQAQTLSSLLSLPISTARIAWEKTCAGLAMNWPPLAFILLSSATPDFVPKLNTLDEICAWFYAIQCALMLPILVAWLSLHLRRGAGSIGFVVWLLGCSLVPAFLGLFTDRFAAMFLPLFCGGLLVFFLRDIPRRLEALASKE
jgi:ABC-type Na+ efflux pump permease subunit